MRILNGSVPIHPRARIQKLSRSAVTSKKWPVDGVTSTIEGLSHEFHIDRCTSEAMDQKNPDLPPI